MLRQLRPSAVTGTELWEEHWRRFAVIRHDRAALRWDGILDWIDERVSGGRMLEAGCGLGRYLLYVQSHGGDVVGIDFALEPLRRIKVYARSARLAGADLAQLPFAGGSFDTILCFGVLEHFERGAEVQARELARLLRPSGWLIVTVPYASFLKRRRARTPGTDIVVPGAPLPPGMQFYQHCFTQNEARALVQSAGCDVIRQRRISRLFWLLGGRSGRSRPRTVASATPRQPVVVTPSPARGLRALARETAYWAQWALPGDLSSHMIAVVGRKQ